MQTLVISVHFKRTECMCLENRIPYWILIPRHYGVQVYFVGCRMAVQECCLCRPAGELQGGPRAPTSLVGYHFSPQETPRPGALFEIIQKTHPKYFTNHHFFGSPLPLKVKVVGSIQFSLRDVSVSPIQTWGTPAPAFTAASLGPSLLTVSTAQSLPLRLPCPLPTHLHSRAITFLWC